MTDLSALATLVESLPLLEAETAAPGPVETFLERVLRRGADEFGQLARKAIRRLVSSGMPGMATPRLFTDGEILELTEIFASANATAELLGRALVRDKQREVEARNLGESRRLQESLAVPIVGQKNSWDCGVACLAAVLKAYGIDVEYGQLRDQLDTTPEKGTTPEDIVRVAEEYECEPIADDGMVFWHLGKITNDWKNPVICAVTMHGGGHYVVVTAARNDGKYDYVNFMDPAEGGREASFSADHFKELWHSTDYRGKRYERYGIAIGRPQGVNHESYYDSVRGEQEGMDRENRSLHSGSRAVYRTDGEGQGIDRDGKKLRVGQGYGVAGEPVASLRGPLLEDLSAPRSLLTPEAALEYFLSLVPTLGIDPQQFGVDMRRHAFTLAWATNQTLLDTVQAILRDVLETGQGVSSTPRLIADVFERAGVQVTNPQYAEMVMRTNMMDAYNQGLEDELRDPDVSETFPVWRYDAIVDSRSRQSHADRDGNYYPGTTAFRTIRGTSAFDVCNCRCVATPVDKWEWQQLQAKGARLA